MKDYPLFITLVRYYRDKTTSHNHKQGKLSIAELVLTEDGQLYLHQSDNNQITLNSPEKLAESRCVIYYSWVNLDQIKYVHDYCEMLSDEKEWLVGHTYTKEFMASVIKDFRKYKLKLIIGDLDIEKIKF